jgi:hypothetical protein
MVFKLVNAQIKIFYVSILPVKIDYSLDVMYKSILKQILNSGL